MRSMPACFKLASVLGGKSLLCIWARLISRRTLPSRAAKSIGMRTISCWDGSSTWVSTLAVKALTAPKSFTNAALIAGRRSRRTGT